MIWPFRRKPKIRDLRHDNEGWQVGDLALCVEDGFSPRDRFDPRVGQTLRVTRVAEGVALGHVLVIGLIFEGLPANVSYQCTAFRKIRPVQEPAEAAFTAWLRDKLRAPETVG